MKLITGLRNEYSFHVPDHAELDRAYGRLPIDIDVAAYSGQQRHSSLYQMSHALLMCGMLELVPDSHSMTDRVAMQVIVDDVLRKAADLNQFIEQLIIVILERHDLSPEPLEVVATVDSHHCRGAFESAPSRAARARGSAPAVPAGMPSPPLQDEPSLTRVRQAPQAPRTGSPAARGWANGTCAEQFTTCDFSQDTPWSPPAPLPPE